MSRLAGHSRSVGGAGERPRLETKGASTKGESMTQQQWFVVRGGKEEGPYTSQQLKQMASSGRLQPNDQVRRADVETVRQANAIKGLFPERETSPPEAARPGLETDPTAKSGATKKWLVIGSVAMALMVLICGGLGMLGTVYNKEKQVAHR